MLVQTAIPLLLNVDFLSGQRHRLRLRMKMKMKMRMRMRMISLKYFEVKYKCLVQESYRNREYAGTLDVHRELMTMARRMENLISKPMVV